jgi:hypothetical protein
MTKSIEFLCSSGYKQCLLECMLLKMVVIMDGGNLHYTCTKYKYSVFNILYAQSGITLACPFTTSRVNLTADLLRSTHIFTAPYAVLPCFGLSIPCHVHHLRLVAQQARAMVNVAQHRNNLCKSLFRALPSIAGVQLTLAP